MFYSDKKLVVILSMTIYVSYCKLFTDIHVMDINLSTVTDLLVHACVGIFGQQC